MKIEHSNWEPASELYGFMDHFDNNIRTIKNALTELPSFKSNFKNEEISQNDINERKNQLIRIGAKVEATIDLLKEMLVSYHNYQEMYFDTIATSDVKSTGLLPEIQEHNVVSTGLLPEIPECDVVC